MSLGEGKGLLHTFSRIASSTGVLDGEAILADIEKRRRGCWNKRKPKSGNLARENIGNPTRPEGEAK